MSNDITTSGLECQEIYTTNFGLDTDMATNLCTSSTNFTFADPFQTSVALTNTYLYQSTFSPFYFNEFLEKTGMALSAVNDTFYGPTKAFTEYYSTLESEIYTHYADDACTTSYVTKTACSFSNITYNQWLDGTILANPLPGAVATSDGYVMHYGKYANGWITPEYSYWRSMNDEIPLPITDYYAAVE